MPASSIAETISLSLSISSETWERTVNFPPGPFQEDDHLENLIVATMLAFKNAGPDRKNANFGLYCFPADGSNNVPLMTPLRLILEDDYLLAVAFHTN